jgi:hypothetical protein
MTTCRSTATSLPSVLALALVAAIGCSDPAAPAPPVEWGSPQASVTILPTTADVAFPCGAGTINATLHPGSRATWTAAGLFYSGGGPVPVEGRPPHAATYSGSFSGDVLTFAVSVPDIGAALGPFQVRKGSPGPSEVCL